MASREELRLQALRDQTQRYLSQPEETEPGLTRIGPLDLRTGRYYQIHQDGTATPDGRKTFDSAHKTGQAVRRIAGSRETHLDGRPATKPRVVETVKAEELLQIALFFGTFFNSYVGGDRPPQDITANIGSAITARIDKKSKFNRNYILTTDAIPGAKNQIYLTTRTTKGLTGLTGEGLGFIPVNFGPSELVNQSFSRENLWFDDPPWEESTPSFPTEIKAIYQGNVLTSPVTSSYSPLPNREIRVTGDVWITPTYTKESFIGYNKIETIVSGGIVYRGLKTYLDYHPLLLSNNQQDCLFRKEEYLTGEPGFGTVDSYISALSCYPEWSVSGGNFFIPSYWILKDGIEYLLTNPEELNLSYNNNVNAYSSMIGSFPEQYFQDAAGPRQARFWSYFEDAIYQLRFPLRLTTGGSGFGAIVNVDAVFEEQRSTPVYKINLTFDSGAGTVTASKPLVSRYRLNFPEQFANFLTQIGGASFAP